MGDRSSIEWTDATWNPIAAFRKDNGKRGWHCEKVSGGCRGCYAETFNGRKLHAGTGLPYTRASRDLVEIRAVNLDMPLRWRKPRRIFVESMSDLFAEFVPDELIDRVFAVMALCPQHTFQILTKRPERIRRYFEAHEPQPPGRYLWAHERIARIMDQPDWIALPRGRTFPRAPAAWPLPNVWLGTSVEDQPTLDDRWPHLRDTPAARRFLSYEPAIGAVDFTGALRCDGCGYTRADQEIHGDHNLCRRNTNGRMGGLGTADWIIVGGESGPGARPFDVAWARSTIAQCRAAGVACFVKQLGTVPVMRLDEFEHTEGWGATVHSGEYCGGPLDDWPGMTRFGSKPHEYVRIRQLRDRKGGDPAEWPEDLRVREFPARP